MQTYRLVEIDRTSGYVSYHVGSPTFTTVQQCRQWAELEAAKHPRSGFAQYWQLGNLQILNDEQIDEQNQRAREQNQRY